MNDQNIHCQEDGVEVDEQRYVVANESFLLENEDLEKHKVEIIAGDKEGSEWLVIDDIYILHTQKHESDNIPEVELVFMYKLDTHDCGQTKLGPIQ